MWIDRKAYEQMLLDNAKLREESRVLNQQNTALQGSIEWFMVRTTQLEKERAAIIENYMGVKVETPDYRRAEQRAAAEVPTNIPQTLNDLGLPNIFNPFGTDESGNA